MNWIIKMFHLQSQMVSIPDSFCKRLTFWISMNYTTVSAWSQYQIDILQASLSMIDKSDSYLLFIYDSFCMVFTDCITSNYMSVSGCWANHSESVLEWFGYVRYLIQIVIHSISQPRQFQYRMKIWLCTSQEITVRYVWKDDWEK